MLNKIANVPEVESNSTPRGHLLKTYSKPSLHELGDLRTLTLGGSGGPNQDTDNVYNLYV